jgi:hypothetical protein
MQPRLLPLLALSASSVFAQSSGKDPMTAVYSYLQNRTPAPQVVSIPANISTCNSTTKIADVSDANFGGGGFHYFLGQNYQWRTLINPDGSLCAVMDAPAQKYISAADLQALLTASKDWGRRSVPGTPPTTTFAQTIVRSFAPGACEAANATIGNGILISPRIVLTTAALANAATIGGRGCFYPDGNSPSATGNRIAIVGAYASSSYGQFPNSGYERNYGMLALQEPVPIPDIAPLEFQLSGLNWTGLQGSAEQFISPYATSAAGLFTAPMGGAPNDSVHLYGGIYTSAIPAPAAVTGGGILNSGGYVIGVLGSANLFQQNASASQPGFYQQRFVGVQMRSGPYAALQGWMSQANTNVQTVQINSPVENEEVDGFLAGLSCTASGSVRWVSSIASPPAPQGSGSTTVATGCNNFPVQLGRGLQFLTAELVSDPKWRKTVRINVLRREATMYAPELIIAPSNSATASIPLTWTSQDLGSNMQVTMQIGSGGEQANFYSANGQANVVVAAPAQVVFRVRGGPYNVEYARINVQVNLQSVAAVSALNVTVTVPTTCATTTTQPSTNKASGPPACARYDVSWSNISQANAIYELQKAQQSCGLGFPSGAGCNWGDYVTAQINSTLQHTTYIDQGAYASGSFLRFRVRACDSLGSCSTWTYHSQ